MDKEGSDLKSDLLAFRSVIFDPDKKRREALAALQKRLPEAVFEDLRKDIPELLTEIHDESLKNKGLAVTPNTRTMARIGTLLAVLYLKAEIETRKVVQLTWALVVLTAGLFAFTVYLAQDAYFKRERYKTAEHNEAKPNHTGLEIHSFTVPY
jgi:hypothetical protein